MGMPLGNDTTFNKEGQGRGTARELEDLGLVFYFCTLGLGWEMHWHTD